MPVNRTVHSWQTAATGLRLTIRAWLGRFSRSGRIGTGGPAACPTERHAPGGQTPYREMVRRDIFRIVQQLVEERDREDPDLDAINSSAKELMTLVKLVRSHEGRQYPGAAAGTRKKTASSPPETDQDTKEVIRME